MSLSPYAKAVVAALGVAYGLYSTATLLASAGGTAVTRDEWVNIAVVTIITGFGVWAVPNGPALPVPAPPPPVTNTVNVDRPAAAPPATGPIRIAGRADPYDVP